MKIELKDPNPAIIPYERAVIGTCLVDPRGHRCWPQLKPHDLFLEKHRIIWKAMLELRDHMDHPDSLAVADHLRGEGFGVAPRPNLLDDIGGPAALADLMTDGMELQDL